MLSVGHVTVFNHNRLIKKNCQSSFITCQKSGLKLMKCIEIDGRYTQQPTVFCLDVAQFSVVLIKMLRE